MNGCPPIRVGVVCDFAEERWPTMDLVADMLLDHLQAFPDAVRPTCLRAPFRRRATRVPLVGGARTAFSVDRFSNRLIDYPRWLRGREGEFDVFHVVDHSYAHLVHQLPAHRTVVTCHDLDTFRSVLEPDRDPRSWPSRVMTRHILDGLQRAARVTCDSAATLQQVLGHRLVPSGRLALVPNGVHPAFTPEPDSDADAAAARLIGPGGGARQDLLHVGSTIPGKRIDLLLGTLAEVRRERPRVRLIQVGGPLTSEQVALARELRVAHALVVVPFVTRAVLAAMYRRASVVVLPSEREGFGLSVAEALACGATVVARNLPVLRETGGDAVFYCSGTTAAPWAGAVLDALAARTSESAGEVEKRRTASLRQAARFSWNEYARRMVDIYAEIASKNRSVQAAEEAVL